MIQKKKCIKINNKTYNYKNHKIQSKKRKKRKQNKKTKGNFDSYKINIYKLNSLRIWSRNKLRYCWTWFWYKLW